MKEALTVVHVIVSVFLIILIVLQARGKGFGKSSFGSLSSQYSTKRGVEKTIHILTIALVIIFILSSLIQTIVF